MKVIPAIDIKGGKVVRLAQGKFGSQTVYSDSPLETAKRWASFGVEMIHIVDLDGAVEGKPINIDIVKKIAATVRPMIELGGGIRDAETIGKTLSAGIGRVVIGTKALDEKFLSDMAGRFVGKIVAGIDARKGYVYTKGWLFKTKVKAIDLATKMEKAGIRAINYTDISKDGMLEGPNIASLQEFLGATSLDVVASGGVSSLDDVRKLKALEKDGLTGIIIGKALYEGKIDLADAMRICSEKQLNI